MDNEPDWVPLIEAARMIARSLSSIPGDNFDHQTRVQAAGILLRALREDRISSRGFRDQGVDRVILTGEDWRKLRAQIDYNRLTPPIKSMRRIAFDDITNIIVNLTDIFGLIECKTLASSVKIEKKSLDNRRPADAEVRRIVSAFYTQDANILATYDEVAEEVRKKLPSVRREQIVKARESFKPLGGWPVGPRSKINPPAK